MFTDTCYDRFAPAILKFLSRQVAHTQDAEDLLLEVFLAAFKSEAFTRLTDEEQLAWLRRVARNKVVDLYRRQHILAFQPLEQADGIEDENLLPEQHLEQRERYDRLYQALETLSDTQRELIMLRYVRGLRLVEIAALLQKPDGTVRKWLSRTLQQLRSVYDQLERGVI